MISTFNVEVGMSKTYTEEEVKELIAEVLELREKNNTLESRLSQKLFELHYYRRIRHEHPSLPNRWKDSNGNQFKLVVSYLESDDYFVKVPLEARIG
jgi:hypothetical protein